jgi:hypothetical protein
MLGQRQTGMGRRHPVAATHPVFGTQIFKVDPQRLGTARGHGKQKGLRQGARKGCNHKLAGLNGGHGVAPLADLHAIDVLTCLRRIQGRDQTTRAFQIIDPQADGNSMLPCQLPCQTPAHTDIAKIIHNNAKEVPAGWHRSGNVEGLRGSGQNWG